MFLEYSIFNTIGKRYFLFVAISIVFSALRNTLARVLTLAVSLGLSITVQNIEKYHVQIGVLSFIYFISNVAYMSVLYLSHHQLISIAVSLFVSVPISVTNGIFFYWILAALERTLAILLEENQKIKFQIMKRFIYSLYFSITLAVVSSISLIVLRIKTERDEMWEYEWVY